MQLLSFLITTVRFVEDFVVVGSETDVVKRLIDVACESNQHACATTGNYTYMAMNFTIQMLLL